MQNKKLPFTILRGQPPSDPEPAKPTGKRPAQAPLYIENILKEVDIPPERVVIDRKIYLVSPDDNMSPSTNSTSEESYPYDAPQPRPLYQTMIYDPSHSLRLINGIAQQREFCSEDYELLLQLDEAHRQMNQKNIGLDEAIIHSFRFWKVMKKTKIGNNGEEGFQKCSICLHEIKIGQIARELPCSHVFHKNCIDKWLKSDTRCPLDNKSIKDMI